MLAYTPPTAADLNELKARLGYTGTQMADLVSVASNSQWRKYTGGADPRALNMHMCFFMAARLSLPPETLRQIGQKMQEIGAEIDPEKLASAT